MSQSQTCSCANRNCFHDDCACFIREGLCSEYCKCRGECKNIWKNEKEVTKRFAQHTKRKAAAAAAHAAQAAAAQAAGQPMPLPAREAGPGMVTRGKAQAVKEAAMGCNCQSGECASRCGCVRRKTRCTSKCKCKFCNNDYGSRFPNKSKAGPGGQGGTRSSSRAVEPAGKRPNHG